MRVDERAGKRCGRVCRSWVALVGVRVRKRCVLQKWRVDVRERVTRSAVGASGFSLLCESGGWGRNVLRFEKYQK